MKPDFPTPSPNHAAPSDLGDFTISRRLLLICTFALFIGALSALVAYCLLHLIYFFTNLFYYQHFSWRYALPTIKRLGWLSVAVPVLGGLIAGLMARFGSEKIRGHGIPEAMEAILLGGSRISAKVAMLKPLASAIVIGSGGPFGAEGPIIMTAGAFGSLFAQLFHLTSAERKTLLVAGASAGMAAIFCTPIAAVLLAVELLLFEWKPRSLIPVAVASVTGSLLRIPLLGHGPIFPSNLQFNVAGIQYPEAAGFGIVAGLLSCVLTLMVYRCEDLFERQRLHWMWWPAIGGVVVGVGGMIDPRVLGVGYNMITAMVQGHLIGATLLILLVIKAIVWASALGSGTSGGVVAPLLIIGGALGISFAVVLGGPPALWAIVGMSAVMGGTMRAPLTATVFLVELTHNLNAMPLVFIATLASITVTALLLKRSILTEKVARRGHHLTCEYGADPLSTVLINDVMDTSVSTVPADTLATALAATLAERDSTKSRHHALAITDKDGLLTGIVTRGDLLRNMNAESADANATVIDAGTKDVVVAFPDEPVRSALHLMLKHEIGRLIIVSREDPRHIIGYLGRPAIFDAQMRHYAEEYEREPGLIAQIMTASGMRDERPEVLEPHA